MKNNFNFKVSPEKHKELVDFCEYNSDKYLELLLLNIIKQNKQIIEILENNFKKLEEIKTIEVRRSKFIELLENYIKNTKDFVTYMDECSDMTDRAILTLKKLAYDK